MTDDQASTFEQEPTTTKTILIVEDDPDVGEFLVQALQLDEARKRKITCLTKPVALDDLLSTIDHDLM